MNKYIDKNFWQEWNISPGYIIKKTHNFIRTSVKNNNKLINMDLTNKKNHAIFLSILANDRTEYAMIHTISKFLQVVGIQVPKGTTVTLVKQSNQTSSDFIKCGYTVNILLSTYASELNIKKAIYDKIVEFYSIIKDDSGYNDIDKRFLVKIIKKYTNSGINLNINDKKLLINYKKEIGKIENTIMRNIIDTDNKYIEFSKKDLSGLPQLKHHIINNNPIKYGISLDNMSYLKCMRYIQNPNVRKYIEYCYGRKCIKNMDNILKLLVLRYKHAQILSFNNHSDYIVTNQMAINSNNINQCLKNLLAKLDIRYYKEMTTLLKVINKSKSKSNSNPKKVNSWDLQYYITQWKLQYGINYKIINKYFPINHVIPTTFSIYQYLFNLKFTKLKNPIVWHKDVTMYEVRQLKSNKLVGYFYLDPYKRHNKTNQIKCVGLRPNCVYPMEGSETKPPTSTRSVWGSRNKPTYPYNKNIHQVPIVAILAPFKKNSLLTHPDVIAFFCEFEYVIYYLCNRSKYCIFNGIFAETEFINTIPLVMGNICWENIILKKLSSHYKTKKPLPDKIINKLKNVKNLTIGINYKIIILNAIYDQMIHTHNKFINYCETLLKNNDIKIRGKAIINYMSTAYKKLYNGIMCYKHNPLYSVQFNDGTFMPGSWKNLIANKDGRSYEYIWSKIISLEIYQNKFLNNGPVTLSSLKSSALDLKKNLIEKGGSIDATILIKNYLGKLPTIDGFLKMYNLYVNPEYSFYLNSDKSTFNNKYNYNSKSNYNNIHRRLNISNKYNNIPSVPSVSSAMYSNKFCEISDTYSYATNNNRMDNINHIKNKLNKLQQEDSIVEDSEYINENIFIKKK